jgi:hypothetical protein
MPGDGGLDGLTQLGSDGGVARHVDDSDIERPSPEGYERIENGAQIRMLPRAMDDR